MTKIEELVSKVQKMMSDACKELSIEDYKQYLEEVHCSVEADLACLAEEMG